MIEWLLTNALGALGLAAIAVILIWTFRPAPAVRHALWLVVLLKLVSPTGLVVEVPLPVKDQIPALVEAPPAPTLSPAEDTIVEVEVFTVVVHPQPGQSDEEAAALAVRHEQGTQARTEPPVETAIAPVVANTEMPSSPVDYRPYLLALWVAGAISIGWRQIRETARFARFARQGRPAADGLMTEVAVVANRLGVRVPAVRVMTGLASPVMWCLWRPTLLWPAGLECRLKGEGRRAVLAHELAHLRRRDHWVRRLEMIAAILHWWNPLFWLARKKMRADAELACDAWAAGQADRRAYAEALLEVCSFNPRRRPAPAVGVFGEGRRAMQERLTMIMRDRVPCRLAFGAKLLVALMAIAAVPAWTLGPGVEHAAAQAPTTDAQVQELEAQIKALAAQLEALKVAKAAENKKAEASKARVKAVEALNNAQLELHGKLQATDEKKRVPAEKVTKEMVVQGQGVKVLTAGEGGYKVIGPDGKEVKNVKIIVGDTKTAGTAVVKPSSQGTTTKIPVVVDAQTGKYTWVPSTTATVKPGTSFQLTPDGKSYSAWATQLQSTGGQSVTLSRATYKLNKDQAAALATLLGSIKATVMETKVDGDSIIVTTTPEAQAAIGQIVRLVQGQGGTTSFQYKVVPATPATPATPAVPVKPAKPAPASQTKPVKPTVLELNEFELKLDNLDIPLQLQIEPATGKVTEKLKELGIQLEQLKDLKELEKLKGIKVGVEKLKDMEKLKELEKLKDVKDLKELQDAIKLLIPAEKRKPDSDKKPDQPAK